MSTSTASRIDADHIAFTDDGHAWWVCDSPQLIGRPHRAEYPDRPCDTCEGTMVGHAITPWKTNPCDHCIDGRHTFEIETECICNGDSPPDPACSGIGPHRVSVVPGMVLPIFDGSGTDQASSPRHIDMHGDRAEIHSAAELQPVTLPPAAAPGMWAVKLKVAP